MASCTTDPLLLSWLGAVDADRADARDPASQSTLLTLRGLAAAGADAILQSFPHGAIIVFDHDLRYLSAGGLGLADVGLSRDLLEGRRIFDVFPEEVIAVIEPLYRAALDGSETVLDVPFHGRIFSQRLGPLRDDGGLIVAGIGFTQDVTESRGLQLALQESEDRLKVVIDNAPMGLAVISSDLRYLEVNPAFCRITGYSQQQLLQSSIPEATHPLYTDADGAGMDRLLRGEVSAYTADIRIHAPDGTIRWVSQSMSVLRSADGSPSDYIVQVKDIGERKLAEHALLDKTRRLKDAEVIGRYGSWELDVATRKVTWSDGLFVLYGIDQESFNGDYRAGLDLTHPDDRALVDAAVQACSEYSRPYKIRYRITRVDDGSLRWLEARGKMLLEDDRSGYIGGSVVDVTDVVLAEIEIQTAYAFQQAVTDASPDVIFAYRLATRSVVWSNHSLAAVLNFDDSDDSLSDLTLDGSRPVPGGPSFSGALLTALDSLPDSTSQTSLRLQDAAGEHRWFSLRTTPLQRDNGAGVTELLGILRDVTEAMVAEKHLQHTALHDSLTGLPNRALLIDRIEGALSRSGRDHREISVLFCDLDGFKRVNDTAGHAAGDAVLVEIAHRLQRALRDGDTVARVGGDEFIILIEPWNRRPAPEDSGNVDPDQIAAQDRALAPRIAARIAEALREPVFVNGLEHVVTASIGITYGSMSHAGDLRTASADDMVQDADAAMYKAKSRGKDRFEVFEQSMRATLQERSRVERLLRQVLNSPAVAGESCALTKGHLVNRRAELTAAYQPIFDSTTQDLVGFEALARLVDAEGVNTPPDVFIAVAEETGVIHQLGLFILDLACGQLAAWRTSTPAMAGVTMAVNVSAIQAANSNLGDDVRNALNGHALQPDDLVLELTETALLQAAHSTIVNLRTLHDEGVGIAIDDFGVGYASLRYLATLPVSALKVDKSFTAGLPHDAVSRKIVTAVAGLAADLDLVCIVEGVETEEQRRALPQGVELQGYLTGRPQPPHLIDVSELATHGASTVEVIEL